MIRVMEILKSFIDAFFEFKAYIMLPFFIIIIGLIIRMPLGRLLKAALQLGTGFAGVFIVFSFFVDNIRPAVEQIIRVRGLDFPVLDVGWPPLAAITWSSPLAPLSIPFIILINIIMIALKTTRTIYIDIWNYWHLALIGALLFAVSHNYFIAFAAITLITIYTIKTADWTAPYVFRESGLEGVTISPVSVVGLLPFAELMDSLYDRIPYVKKWNFNPHTGDSRLNQFADPMVIGFFMGILLGIGAGYSVKTFLELGIHIAAVMYLLPKCGELIGEGISPISNSMKERIQNWFPGRSGLNVAVDTGILMNNKSVIVSGLILMPIALGIALILPGNRTLPLGDLPNLLSVISVTVLISRGNVIRSVFTGIPVVVTFLLISSSMAELFTNLSQGTGMDMGQGQLITAFTDGGNHIRFYLYHLFQGNVIALASIPFIGLLLYLSHRRYKKNLKAEGL
ncbi:PTS transporter subunit IIC [Oceanispirochaeta sp.]|jgi:PTS system galactitol-specific IIC component|uniref:PTS transporter subunit IIC n=1 Tax=Oceanispirochaeta sp. TaxID=2035350 RepID=UPI00260C3FFE|nr:PTS transporter subunit IIC [Oceanispirochaeta sp.]MDA3955418.1 PTS galactitol transporter subunit IIC [Oceanispirochaeta sp.]